MGDDSDMYYSCIKFNLNNCLIFLQSTLHQALHVVAGWTHKPPGPGCLCVAGRGAQVVGLHLIHYSSSIIYAQRHVLIVLALVRFKRILVLISHSQDFLNGVCTNIIHLHQRKLKYYTVRTLGFGTRNPDWFCKVKWRSSLPEKRTAYL